MGRQRAKPRVAPQVKLQASQSVQFLSTAISRTSKVSVKRLTRKNPTMAAKFDEVRGEE